MTEYLFPGEVGFDSFDQYVIGSLSVERRLEERSIKSQKASQSAKKRWNKTKQNDLRCIFFFVASIEILNKLKNLFKKK